MTVGQHFRTPTARFANNFWFASAHLQTHITQTKPTFSFHEPLLRRQSNKDVSSLFTIDPLRRHFSQQLSTLLEEPDGEFHRIICWTLKQHMEDF